MENPKFQIYPGSNGQFYFRLLAANGEKILSSESYFLQSSCENGVHSVKTNAPYDTRYERKLSSNGQYYFVLKSGNGEVIGTSEMYYTTQGRDNGIEAVKRDAPKAPIEYLLKTSNYV